jgi:hypothetical protein
MRTIVFLALLAFAGWTAAQGAGDGERGSTPPGLSQDGARPAEGAIKGGSIAPGESGGMPDKSGGRAAGEAAAGGTAKGLARCYQLEGSLREQCLAQERDDTLNSASDPRAPSSGGAQRRRD